MKIDNKLIINTRDGTGSTLVINIVLGFFEPDQPVTGITKHQKQLIKERKFRQVFDNFSSRMVLKAHFPEMFNYIDTKYITIHRENKPMSNKIYNRDNILVLEYSELLYKSKYNPHSNKSVEQVVNYVANEIENKFPDIKITEHQRKSSHGRVLNMDKVYESIKHKPFRYVDKFYHIHGSHRNRSIKK